jgi:DNA-binding NarL/FixJ family response regulator
MHVKRKLFVFIFEQVRCCPQCVTIRSSCTQAVSNSSNSISLTVSSCKFEQIKNEGNGGFMAEPIPKSKPTSSMLGSALRMGSRAVASLRNTNNANDRAPITSHLLPSSQALESRSDIDAIFRQHPDLFRDTSQTSDQWDIAFHKPAQAGVRTLLVRSAHAQEPLRECIMADTRLHFCGMAERLGDACRQIRQQSFSVIVFAMNEHTQDMLPLLELMNSSNPRAKAIAVLDRQASKNLQQMIHPKVLGYVAAQEVCSHLADAVMEVSQGRFTASPAMSSIVMRLTSHYLAQPANTPSGSTSLTTALADQTTPTAPTAHERADDFDATSEKYVSSFHSSHFAPVSSMGHSISSARQLLSEREMQILQLIAGGLSSNDIAHELSISVPTVNTHVRNIFTKLNVRNRAQAIHVGISHGLILVE